MNLKLAGCVLLALTVGVFPCAIRADGDPLVSINRPIHKFNDRLDRMLVRPVARFYEWAVPGVGRRGVSNFFANLGDVGNMTNNLLQGKPGEAVSDLGRLLVNSTIGIAGLVDVASPLGLDAHEEDFGQTLATWHVGQGPYLVLPFLGPSTLRDALARPIDTVLSPIRHIDHVPTRNSLYAVELLDKRVSLLGAESVVFGDKYIFYRDAYLQRREYLVHDGEVADSFDDDF